MNKTMLWVGRVLSALPGIFLLTGGINVTFIHSKEMLEGFSKFGYPASAMTPIGITLLTSSLLYLIPQTCIFGAILLTAYLGGAVATHVHNSDGMFPIPIVVGILIWLGLYLRDDRLRALVPLRKPTR